jgi:hypothetical protein
MPVHRQKSGPYDASSANSPCNTSYDASVLKNLRKSENEPTASQPYDQSAAIRLQNTIPVRQKYQNPYHASLASFTMPKKFATYDNPTCLKQGDMEFALRFVLDPAFSCMFLLLSQNRHFS